MCVLFVDDIVLVDELRNSMNAKLERWWEGLESKGFKFKSCKDETCELQLQCGCAQRCYSFENKAQDTAKRVFLIP